MEPKQDLTGILRKVRGLLDKADSTDFEPEAVTYRAKAEELMRKYRIEEEQTLATDVDAVIRPTFVRIDVCGTSNPFYAKLFGMMWDIVEHADCLVRGGWEYVSDPATGRRQQRLIATLVGYEVDLRYAEMIYTSARLVWSQRIQPKYDPALSEGENVYRLRSAGVERHRVATMLWGVEPNNGPASAKVQRIYRAECARRDETPAVSGRGVNAKTYREAFAEAFVDRLRSRLLAARNAADSLGGLPVLHGRKERVQEKFYELFPESRPLPAGSESSADSDETPKKKSRRSGWTKADQAKYNRLHNSNAAVLAQDAGARAAGEVALHGVTPAARIEASPEDCVKWSEIQ